MSHVLVDFLLRCHFFRSHHFLNCEEK
jgi:hypothetical protein